ncbi:hypothetical protein [Mycobacterium riyadhense]|uniref:Uncharacterized protein n=1 Tax=Mycobacterium riyadhense TaxID=486698 RepID=A0A1X2D8M3_9MYCO|nr:hypothetical protein [Mycobacterium riyadhense]MCV7146122.1 hypothetical protein [Mycobacterium riyadhense]ORW84089.1 hypothetical protein AWC22_13945 [Mycobacterium riyadhense]VTP01455.1 hypothetical protein BIN_B_04016 [Mycobacterium riyadhense]
MSSVLIVTACTVTAGLLVRMVIAGFITRSGVIFSWPMFANPSYCYLELSVDKPTGSEPVNFWDYAISADVSLTSAGAQRFLNYLREVKSMHVNGRVIIDDARGLQEMRVCDGHLVG